MGASGPFETYNKKRLELRESELAKEMEHGFIERLAETKAEMMKSSQNAQVMMARDHIIEKILTLHCPRCNQAFIDFDGCFSLTCSRKGCKHCGSVSHPCAIQCGRARNMDVFGSPAEFELIQKERKQRLVAEYL